MNTPIITWLCIVTLLLLLILIRCIRAMASSSPKNKKRHTRLIEFGSERELLFIPGDPDPKSAYDYDCTDSL